MRIHDYCERAAYKSSFTAKPPSFPKYPPLLCQLGQVIAKPCLHQPYPAPPSQPSHGENSQAEVRHCRVSLRGGLALHSVAPSTPMETLAHHWHELGMGGSSLCVPCNYRKAPAAPGRHSWGLLQLWRKNVIGNICSPSPPFFLPSL